MYRLCSWKSGCGGSDRVVGRVADKLLIKQMMTGASGILAITLTNNDICNLFTTTLTPLSSISTLLQLLACARQMNIDPSVNGSLPVSRFLSVNLRLSLSVSVISQLLALTCLHPIFGCLYCILSVHNNTLANLCM